MTTNSMFRILNAILLGQALVWVFTGDYPSAKVLTALLIMEWSANVIIGLRSKK